MRRDEKIIYKNERGQSIEFSVWSPFFLESTEGIDGLTNTIYTNKSIYQDGVSYENDTLNPRNIVIQGSISNNKVRNREKLLSILNPKLEGTLTYINKNIERQIDCRIESAPKINRNIKPKFIISFLCPDPYWNDIKETRQDVSTEVGNFSFPWEIPEEGTELSIRVINFISNLYNEGDVETPLKIHLRASGTVENPIIENINTGEYIKIKRTLSDGDILEINTEFGNKRVELIKSNGDRENVFQYIDHKSRFFTIASGDTQIKYDAEVGENNLDVYIYYTPKYLGV